ncbi:methyltransferase [Mumia quercus]|uniref:methyltransferase n=1 Tax=Mumia quercus TaxID=2976125 RepID=UPI0021D3C78A|nr:methyltransferase [Mumia quercus]
MTSLSTQALAFGHLTIAYDGSVLHPRPWTARQSALAAELAASAPDGAMLEIFSGVGHIGLLAAAQAGRDLVQVDANPAACAFAETNAAAAELAVSVTVRCGMLEDALEPHERFAVVIADPPWVPSDEVTRYPDDPPFAIDGGSSGMDLVWSSLDVIEHHLAPGGYAVVQVGPDGQADALVGALDGRALEHVSVERLDRGALVALVSPTRR